jgi:hypothetical protein
VPVSYTVESGAAQRARQRRRTAITLVAVAAILIGVFYYASSYWNQGPSRSAASVTCTPNPSGGITAGQVTVNVYNATKRNGLAASTAKSLKERGFVIGTTSNDPAKKAIAAPAEVRFGPAGEKAAALVIALVTGALPVKDSRADGSVDLVLGDGFTTLVPASTATSSPGATPAC